MSPAMMKVVRILGDKTHPVVSDGEISKPEPTGEQILVEVHAAGVIGDELGWPELWQSQHQVPGHEISGTTAAFGPAYGGDLELGQDVFGFLGTDGAGEGQAEYAIALPAEVVAKPKSLEHKQAAALPIPILTAEQALFDHGNLKPGMSLLVTGASGAVGALAVQQAAQVEGVQIVALASSKHHPLLKEMGASQCLDYHDGDWYEQVPDMDVVFDTVGGKVLHQAWDVVKSHGVIVTVADPAPDWAFGNGLPEELSTHSDVRYAYFILTPDAEKLQRAADLLDQGKLQPLKVQTFSIHQAVAAWDQARQRGRDAKVVLTFGEAI